MTGGECFLGKIGVKYKDAHCSTRVQKTPSFQAEDVIGKLDSMPSPRLIKSHLPFELLPPDLLDTCKVVFVARFSAMLCKSVYKFIFRNVKDAAVSFFYHERLMKHHDLIDMSFERFL